MNYLNNYYNKTQDMIKITGLPIINKNGEVKSIDIRKSWLNLYGTFIPDELARLEKRADKIITDLLYYLLNNKQFYIDIMEEQLTAIYDMMFYMVCTGKEDTIDYKEDWKKEWDETDECFNVDFYFDENLFLYSLHVIRFYHKMKDTLSEATLKRILKKPLTNII